jgi:hypothetical protein
MSVLLRNAKENENIQQSRIARQVPEDDTGATATGRLRVGNIRTGCLLFKRDKSGKVPKLKFDFSQFTSFNSDLLSLGKNPDEKRQRLIYTIVVLTSFPWRQ